MSGRPFLYEKQANGDRAEIGSVFLLVLLLGVVGLWLWSAAPMLSSIWGGETRSAKIARERQEAAAGSPMPGAQSGGLSIIRGVEAGPTATSTIVVYVEPTATGVDKLAGAVVAPATVTASEAPALEPQHDFGGVYDVDSVTLSDQGICAGNCWFKAFILAQDGDSMIVSLRTSGGVEIGRFVVSK
jgi:hypothetical protein